MASELAAVTVVSAVAAGVGALSYARLATLRLPPGTPHTAIPR
jgi:hypothetical protein